MTSPSCRNRGRIGNDENIDSDFAALEDIRTTRMPLLAGIRPSATISNPAMNWVLDSLNFSVKKMEGVAIVRDAQRGIFVNSAQVIGTNTFITMCARLETSSKTPTAGN